MRKLGIYLGVILLAVCFIHVFSDQLVLFIFLGKIPFTNITLPARVMIVFWIIVLPAVLFFRKTVADTFWKIAESVSNARQRRVKMKQRKCHYPLIPDEDVRLISIYFLYIINAREGNLAKTGTQQRLATVSIS